MLLFKVVDIKIVQIHPVKVLRETWFLNMLSRLLLIQLEDYYSQTIRWLLFTNR